MVKTARTVLDEPRRLPKPLRILIGIVVMGLFTAAALGFVLKRAGDWGIPYFSYTAPGGTICTNTIDGHNCPYVTKDDFQRWSNLDVPEGTMLLRASYASDLLSSTMSATLRTDADQAEDFLALLTETFGDCQPGGVEPAELDGFDELCIANSARARGTQGVSFTRSWSFATGLNEDGLRVTVLTVGVIAED